MRAIAVEPAQRTIAVTEVHFDGRVIAERFASHPRVVVRFPNGDVLLAAPTDATEAFTVGGSKPIVGSALLVGRRNVLSEHAAARTSLDDVRSMVRWTPIERKIESTPPTSPRAKAVSLSRRARRRPDGAQRASPVRAVPRAPMPTAYPERMHQESRADDPVALLRLILRRVRQRASVILNPYVIPRIDPAVARLASEKMISLADVSPVGAFAEYRPARSRFIDRHDRRHLAVPLKKVRPWIAPRPDLTGARGTSARAAISFVARPIVRHSGLAAVND